jgi:hypothetical protein
MSVAFERLRGDEQYVQCTAITWLSYEQWCRHQHEIGLRAQVEAGAAERCYWALRSEVMQASNSYSVNNIVPFIQAQLEDAQTLITAGNGATKRAADWCD